MQLIKIPFPLQIITFINLLARFHNSLYQSIIELIGNSVVVFHDLGPYDLAVHLGDAVGEQFLLGWVA